MKRKRRWKSTPLPLSGLGLGFALKRRRIRIDLLSLWALPWVSTLSRALVQRSVQGCACVPAPPQMLQLSLSMPAHIQHRSITVASEQHQLRNMFDGAWCSMEKPSSKRGIERCVGLPLGVSGHL